MKAAAIAVILSACCPSRIVRIPVIPPPCLTERAPLPPFGSTAPSAWSAYHVRLEAWTAKVEASCGAHLTEGE